MAEQQIHFSIDDVSMRTCTHGDDVPGFWPFVDELHERWGASVDCYCFAQACDQRATTPDDDVRSTRTEWFRSRPWIRFAPHARCAHRPLHEEHVDDQRSVLVDTAARLQGLTGSRTAPWARFHYFSEPLEMIDDLLGIGIDTVLLTDKPAVSYRLDSDHVDELRSSGATRYGGVTFRRSHLRIELLDPQRDSVRSLASSLERIVSEHDVAVVLTHAYELERPCIREMTHRLFRAAKQIGLTPVVHDRVLDRTGHP